MIIEEKLLKDFSNVYFYNIILKNSGMTKVINIT